MLSMQDVCPELATRLGDQARELEVWNDRFKQSQGCHERKRAGFHTQRVRKAFERTQSTVQSMMEGRES